jgi:hypothetical protein
LRGALGRGVFRRGQIPATGPSAAASPAPSAEAVSATAASTVSAAAASTITASAAIATGTAISAAGLEFAPGLLFTVAKVFLGLRVLIDRSGRRRSALHLAQNFSGQHEGRFRGGSGLALAFGRGAGFGFALRRGFAFGQSRGGSGMSMSVAHAVAGFIFLEVFENIADVEESVAVQADIHEGGLHAGQDAVDSALVNAANERELFFALDIDFYELTFFQNRDSPFMGGCGDNQFF